VSDHSASRRVDVLREEAPHLIEPAAPKHDAAALAALRELLVESYSQGGPTPIADALSRWRDLQPWQARRPIERTLAVVLLDFIASTT
jgi:hypothetical protein